jgi:hypothetical protein
VDIQETKRIRMAGPLPRAPDSIRSHREGIVKRLVAVTIVGLFVGGAVLGADKPGKQKKHKGARQAVVQEERSSVSVHVAFGSREVEIMRTHYAPRYRSLPPGLAKKYARTGQLPPGWQKKMEPMPVAVERELIVLPAPYRRGVIDGHAVIYNSRTNVIIDVAVLF